MKKLFNTCRRAGCLALLLGLAAGAAQAQDYFNITVGGAVAPGVFGEITIGGSPPPPVINTAPVIVTVPARPRPLAYLYVPEEHRRDWARYCVRYQACDRPVHFVEVRERDHWWERRAEERREGERERRFEEREEHERPREHGEFERR